MTLLSEVINDPTYIKCLDKGFVGLVDTMGSDAAICRAARMSYGAGTKTINEDRGLIRYLIRHKHTSPIEMAEVKLHIKLPIFVMRQLVRHRTSSLNEYSGRYSVMSDEFYIPDIEYIQPQSTTNRQGRDGELTDFYKHAVRNKMEAHFDESYEIYKMLLGDEKMDGIDEEFPGIAREMARNVLPVANYTEVYWKQNLHNLLHLLKLRRDSHAQYEIRVYAEAIFKHIQPLFPQAIEAWEDYVWNALTLSSMERALLQHILSFGKESVQCALTETTEVEFANSFGLSLREFKEFRTTWGI